MIEHPARLMTLDEIAAAPGSILVFLEWRLPRQYHTNGIKRVDTIRAMIHRNHMQAHYEQWFRCWTDKPSPEAMKETKWRV